MPAKCPTASAVANSGEVPGEIMLFGVRVTVDSMRKSVSMNNLAQYEQPHEPNSSSDNNRDEAVAGGYASADDAVRNSTANRSERKRGVPWTEDEHKLFLLGLQKVGKGDWRGISRNFVKTRTPTQVASHAQKYFLRRSNLNRRRRRSSLFDITTDSVTATPTEVEQVGEKENTSLSNALPSPPPEGYDSNRFPLLPAFPMAVNPVVVAPLVVKPMEILTLAQRQRRGSTNHATTTPIRPFPISPVPVAPTTPDLSLNSSSVIDPSPLSLRLSLTSDQTEPSSRHSAFQVMSSFSNGDNSSIISVA